MTTTRSLLWVAVTAGWMSWKRQRRCKLWLSSSSARGCLRVSFLAGTLGRITTPWLRAFVIAARVSCSESGLHTTRVSPTRRRSSAEASERAFGTRPPAAGLTDVSGRGSGQYDVRSTWATAAVAGASTPRRVRASAPCRHLLDIWGSSSKLLGRRRPYSRFRRAAILRGHFGTFGTLVGRHAPAPAPWNRRRRG